MSVGESIGLMERPVTAAPQAQEARGPAKGVSALFESFFMAGFECSSHRRRDGRRLDLIKATEHDVRVREDYLLVQEHGMRTVDAALAEELARQQALYAQGGR